MMLSTGWKTSAVSYTHLGQVVDEMGEPIIGATVMIKGVTGGTITAVSYTHLQILYCSSSAI